MVKVAKSKVKDGGGDTKSEKPDKPEKKMKDTPSKKKSNEEDVGRSNTYETLLNQVPAECVTIPIIMECLLEQVLLNVDKPTKDDKSDSKDSEFSEFDKFGRPDWGGNILQNGLKTLPTHKISKKEVKTNPVGPMFSSPLYIKNGDYASIRSCHLNETVASHIASAQVAGDLRNLQGLLYDDVPEFSPGLYIKLLANLNHFMYFLPPEAIRFEDMFFILHLLMSAGVEAQLHKEAELARKTSESKNLVHKQTTELFSSHADATNNNTFEGTNLGKDHNYLAVNESTGIHFIMATDSNTDIKISSLGHSKQVPEEAQEGVENESSHANLPTKVASTVNSEKMKAADFATKKAIDAAAELADKLPTIHEEDDEMGGEGFNEDEGFTEMDVEEQEENGKRLPPETADENYNFGEAAAVTNSESNRFIACDAEWFKDMQDFSVFKALFECPALLAISESGALDLSKWIETYLLSSGMCQAGGDGTMIGNLKDWNYVEELVPIQTVQLLNENILNYLSMQRMYCPFYDTLLFIFNNPVPKELKSESQYYYKLKTLPGLEHFLENTINDDDVMSWIMGLEKGKGVEVIDSLSVATLMKMVPEEQWLLDPSIKYMLYKGQTTTQIAPSKLKSIDHQSETALALLEGIEDKSNKINKKGKQSMTEKASELGSKVKKRNSKRKLKEPEKDHHSATDVQMEIVPEEQWLLDPSIKYMNKGQTKTQIAPSKLKSLTEHQSETALALLEGVEDKSNKITKKGKQSMTDEASEFSSKAKKRNSKRKSKEPEKDHHSATDVQMDAIPSFHIIETIGRKMSKSKAEEMTEKEGANKNRKSTDTKFDFYDLGKRVIEVASDIYHLFPMDGTIIEYDISTIEPEFRMMQLKVSKNGHQTFFYPYYIPHELDLSSETYVVCPYFHMVHANGTVFAFQDSRASEAAPYIKVSLKQSTEKTLFSYDKVIFSPDEAHESHETDDSKGKKMSENPPHHSDSSEKGKRHSNTPPQVSEQLEVEQPSSQPEDGTDGAETVASDLIKKHENEEDEETQEDGKKEKMIRASKSNTLINEMSKNLDKKSKKPKLPKGKEQDQKEKHEKKKEKGDKKGKGKHESKVDQHTDEAPRQTTDTDETESSGDATAVIAPAPEISTNVLAEGGEWVYSEGELSDTEGKTHLRKKKSFYAPNWDKAEIIIKPMVHSLKITLPSGLKVEISDVNGPPLRREVRQSYCARGTAAIQKESARYYTMNGTVIKFMMNGTIQILTARGVTTNIKELVTNAQRDEERLQEVFETAKSVKIFNGDIILPTGEFWHIVHGNKVDHDPIYLFTSGPFQNGETFRRRQDGVIFLHRHDGTAITHYPDGTRFTTRMVLQKNLPEELDGWVVVGLKYMIEHPNYCSVIFNTISGNSHIRLPLGDWVRVFADGSAKVTTTDNYSMDVDQDRVVLSNPPCGSDTDKSIPNLTAVKLWHSGDAKENSDSGTTSKSAANDVHEASELEEQGGSDNKRNGSSEQEEGGRTNSGEAEEARNSKSSSLKSSNQIKVRPSKHNNEGTGKKTRGGKSKNTSLKSLRKSSGDTISTSTIKKDAPKSNITVEDLEGEPLEEEEFEAEEDDLEEEEVEQDLEQSETLKKEDKKFEIQQFLKFTDATLLCKAIDSWDNRFAVDVNGETIADRKEKADSDLSTEELIKTLSEHCNLPQEFVSGILRTTSSDDLATAAQRIKALKKSPIEQCGALPPTKIFVVKRDLTGYEYLKEKQVEALVNKAKNFRESMVMVDPLPNREPRKYLTIMEPITQTGKPHGTWINQYREPAFRPAILTNKHMKVSTRDDLRWFGYVLTKANAKRPTFIPNAREEYARKKKSLLLNRSKTVVKQTKAAVSKISQEPITVSQDDFGGEQMEEEEASTLAVTEKVDKKGKSGREKGKPKPDKKTKEKVKKEKSRKSKSDMNKEENLLSDEKPVKKPSVKEEKKHGKKSSSISGGLIRTSVGAAQDNPSEVGVQTQTPVQVEAPIKGQKRSILNTEVDQYPTSLPDLKGVYDDGEPIRFQPQFHADICSEKKAVVVRSFVEIPQIDDKMQRALLAASVSYSQTVEAQLEVFDANKFVDPRSEEEKQHQSYVKQQLVENNLSDMHMLEQRAGRVLRFHF